MIDMLHSGPSGGRFFERGINTTEQVVSKAKDFTHFTCMRAALQGAAQASSMIVMSIMMTM